MAIESSKGILDEEAVLLSPLVGEALQKSLLQNVHREPCMQEGSTPSGTI
jgi:hypothetical protein